MKLYEQLANSIAQSIHDGAICRGDKLPSVRHARQSRNVSPSTVFQYYYLLSINTLRIERFHD